MRRLYLLIVTLLTLGACASTGGGANEMTVQVINDGTASTNLTVYAVPESGIRNLLGTVGVNDTASFTFQTMGIRYRLLGRTIGGDEILSPEFSARPEDMMRWQLRTNNVFPVSTGR